MEQPRHVLNTDDPTVQLINQITNTPAARVQMMRSFAEKIVTVAMVPTQMFEQLLAADDSAWSDTAAHAEAAKVAGILGMDTSRIEQARAEHDLTIRVLKAFLEVKPQLMTALKAAGIEVKVAGVHMNEAGDPVVVPMTDEGTTARE